MHFGAQRTCSSRAGASEEVDARWAGTPIPVPPPQSVLKAQARQWQQCEQSQQVCRGRQCVVLTSPPLPSRAARCSLHLSSSCGFFQSVLQYRHDTASGGVALAEPVSRRRGALLSDLWRSSSSFQGPMTPRSRLGHFSAAGCQDFAS